MSQRWPFCLRKLRDWLSSWTRGLHRPTTWRADWAKSTQWTRLSVLCNRKSRAWSVKTPNFQAKCVTLSRIWDYLQTKTQRSCRSSTSTSSASSRTTRRTTLSSRRSINWYRKTHLSENKLEKHRNHWDCPVPLRPNWMLNSISTENRLRLIMLNLRPTASKFKSWWLKTTLWVTKCVALKKTSDYQQEQSASSPTNSK